MVFRLRFGPSALLTTASRFFAVTGGPGIAFCRTEHKAEGRPVLHSAFWILHSPAAQEWYRPPPAVRPFHHLGLSLHGTLRALLPQCRFDRGTISPGGEIVNRGFSPAGNHMGPPLRRYTGSFFVIARRAAGLTRQSVSPSKEKRIPTAPPGPRNDGAGARCAPLQTAGVQKIISNP